MPIRLICIDKALKNGPGYLTAGGSYRVGRSSRCAFIVSDLSVSRIHAVITACDNRLLVKDMGSRNGTFVDGVRIEEAEIQAGQLVRFGNIRFQFIGSLDDGESAGDLSVLSTRYNLGKPVLQPEQSQLISKAQVPVLELLLKGVAEKEIAARLFLSQHTVHKHIKAIYRKLRVNTRAALLALLAPDPKKPEPSAE
jgi:pSer/pThr/pTyr-binding forkhead associated (FHA) protein